MVYLLRNGGPAFPGVTVNDSDVNLVDPFGTLLPPNGQATYSGMSLRDYFAIHASEADLRRWIDEGLPRVRARYAFADQMLRFRATEYSGATGRAA